MHVFSKFLLATLGLGLATSQLAHAQLGVGTGATAPRTMLDVNGAIATYETAATFTGANPTYAVAAGVGQLLLSPGGSAPTGTIALTAAATPAPVAGQRLVVVNGTTIPATLNGQTIPAALTVEFVYSASGWRATGDGGNGTAFANGLTKNAVTNSVGLGGALTGATDIATAGNSLTFSGAGKIGVGVAPTQPLDVNGTARLRSIPSNGGTVMLTADNDGVIRQQALPTASAPTITGALGAGTTLSSTVNLANYYYTGSYITIPANSKYIVQAYMLLGGSVPTTSTQSFWVRSSFSESASSFVQSGDIVGSPFISGLLASNTSYGMMVGAVILRNTSSSAKTYYYWAGNSVNTGNYMGTIPAFGSNSWSENQLMGIPSN